MRAQPLTLLLVIGIAFALFTPSFWIIDIAQAQAPDRDAGSSQPTLRFDESRAETGEADECSEASCCAASGLRCEGADPEQADSSSALVHASCASAALPAVEIRLPLLSRGALQQLSTCLMPPSPLREVPTTPPLIAA